MNDSRLWREFVPVAFHVDYWDNLGWKDPFASAEWTARQRTYGATWKAESVYTPAFVLNGREWHGTTIPGTAGKAPGVLKMTVRNSDVFLVSFEPAEVSTKNFDVYVARLGFGINVNVRAGENSGRNLRHDFVVLSLAHEKFGPERSQEVQVPSSKSDSAVSGNRMAVAAWVTNTGDITPIQAVGGWLPSKPGLEY